MGFHDEESASDSSSEKAPFLSDSSERRHASRLGMLHVFSWTAQVALFMMSLVLFVSPSWHKASEESCVRKQSTFSPALDAISDDYETWRFNGTLAAPSPYKGPPSPDVDAAWDAITKPPIISVPFETLQKIGAPDNAVQLPEESGGGYMAEVAVFHQIHCVNMLWKGTYSDYYKDHSISWTDPPEIVRQHLDHCADMLRQKLMCDADAGLITFNWVKGYARPYENFNSVHKCRNFDALLEWTHAHAAPNSPSGRLTRLPGSVDLETPP